MGRGSGGAARGSLIHMDAGEPTPGGVRPPLWVAEGSAAHRTRGRRAIARRFLTAPARCGERRVVQGEERLHTSRPMSIQPDDAQVRAEGRRAGMYRYL